MDTTTVSIVFGLKVFNTSIFFNLKNPTQMDVPLQFSPTILFILLLFNWQIWPEWILTHDTLGALHAKKDVPFQLLPS